MTAVVFVVSFVFSYGPDALHMSLWAAITVSLVAAGAVWLSRSHPALALALVLGLALGLPLIRAVLPVLDLVAVLVVFRAIATTTLPAAGVAAASLIALTVNDTWQRLAADESFARPSVLYPALLTALSVGAGMRDRQIHAQHQELMRLRDADRLRAVSDERRRIARDLHDIAAHHLSALVVRNQLALRIDTSPALEEAATFTHRTASDALTAMRQVVQVLNTDDAAPMTPSPSLADLGPIIERMGAAGLQVDHGSLDLPPMERDLAVAVVRIATEALANVLRHRGPGACWLRLAHDGKAIELCVDDDGPTVWDPTRAGRSSLRPGRYGVLGMYERAEACGGRLLIEPSQRGGWLVTATLPAARP